MQLQSRPDLSYEVNRAAQRSSAPTIADARALNAISLKAQRSSETTLRYPRGVIDVSAAQLVTYGDASFVNGEVQLGHLVYWTSNTIKHVVWSTLASEAYSVSEAVEEAQWLRSVLVEMWPYVPCSLPRSLRTVEMDSLRRPIVTLSDSFNLCQAVKSDKRTGSERRLRIVTAMLRQVFCGAQSDTCACYNSHDVRRRLDKGLRPLPMNARRYVFVTSDSSTGAKTTLLMPSEPVPTLKMAAGSSRIAIWKVWSEHSLNPLKSAVSESHILVFLNERLQHHHCGSHEENENFLAACFENSSFLNCELKRCFNNSSVFF